MSKELLQKIAPLFAEAKRQTAGELVRAYAARHNCSLEQAKEDLRAALNEGAISKTIAEGRKVLYSCNAE